MIPEIRECRIQFIVELSRAVVQENVPFHARDESCAREIAAADDREGSGCIRDAPRFWMKRLRSAPEMSRADEPDREFGVD